VKRLLARPYLPFSEPALPLRDILDGIAMIEEFTRGMNFESFREDAKTVAAVERKLLSIGERLSDSVSERPSCARSCRGETYVESGTGSGISMTAWMSRRYGALWSRTCRH
jgi:hypothetical protein